MEKQRNTLKKQFDLTEIFTYFFRKKDPNRKENFNLKVMHGINKISIIVFLLAFLVWIVKRILL